MPSVTKKRLRPLARKARGRTEPRGTETQREGECKEEKKRTQWEIQESETQRKAARG